MRVVATMILNLVLSNIMYSIFFVYSSCVLAFIALVSLESIVIFTATYVFLIVTVLVALNAKIWFQAFALGGLLLSIVVFVNYMSSLINKETSNICRILIWIGLCSYTFYCIAGSSAALYSLSEKLVAHQDLSSIISISIDLKPEEFTAALVQHKINISLRILWAGMFSIFFTSLTVVVMSGFIYDYNKRN